jgi:hypothetical protein
VFEGKGEYEISKTKQGEVHIIIALQFFFKIFLFFIYYKSHFVESPYDHDRRSDVVGTSCFGEVVILLSSKAIKGVAIIGGGAVVLVASLLRSKI